MPSWIGPWEIAIVLVLALLIFGPRKLPDLGASLGKSIRGFKKGLKETEDEVSSAVAEVKEATDVSTAEPQVTAAQTEPTAQATADAGAEVPPADPELTTEAPADPASAAAAPSVEAEATVDSAEASTEPAAQVTAEKSE